MPTRTTRIDRSETPSDDVPKRDSVVLGKGDASSGGDTTTRTEAIDADGDGSIDDSGIQKLIERCEPTGTTRTNRIRHDDPQRPH